MKTKETILNVALELFNTNGIDGVGVREIARHLNISVGNLSYHYPKKEDLLLGLSEELRQSNSGIFQSFEPEKGLKSLLGMYRRIFENQIRFKCIFLNSVYIMQQYPRLYAYYMEGYQQRQSSILHLLESLIQYGHLKPLDPRQLGYVTDWMALFSRFWLANGLLSHPEWSDSENMEHSLALLESFLLSM